MFLIKLLSVNQGEGYRIRLARSPQDDPKLKYRKEVEKRADASEFSIPAKMLLMDFRREFGISDTDAEAIEIEVLKPYREYEKKLEQYRDALRRSTKQESLIKSRTLEDLRDLRDHLQLKLEDVIAIEQQELQGQDLESYAAEVKRKQAAEAKVRQQQQAALKLKRQQEELERQHQAQIEAERKLQAGKKARLNQEEQKAAEKRRREAKARQRQQVEPKQKRSHFDFPTPLSRQQFLKWSGLSIGLVAALGISQVFKSNQPLQADYSRLEELLKVGQWEEADQETLDVMLKIANREEEGWLDVESLRNFPCGVLGKIDQLWVKASEGKFGFSVQKKIYVEDCGGTTDGKYDETAWYCFADKVGWRVGEWLSYSDVTFDTTAPEGHLPVVGFWKGGFGAVFGVRFLSCR